MNVHVYSSASARRTRAPPPGSSRPRRARRKRERARPVARRRANGYERVVLDQATDVHAGAFLDALLRGSARDAEAAVRAALDSGLAPAEVHVRAMAPAMRTIGELWARDEITVADEHLATAITYRALNVVSAATGDPPAPARRRVMLAALEDERHVLGLQMVADTLTAAGFDVMALGADVPLPALLAAVARYASAALGLSVTMPAGRPRLAEALDRIRAVDPDLTVMVGGAGAGASDALAPAMYVADAEQAVGAVEALLGAA
jgi:MerR family transcriptional regulator, light-induced transcriptional regulator